MKIPTSILLALVFFCGFKTAASGGVTSDNLVGYSLGGAGFAFSPLTNVSLTGLGYGGSDLFNAPYLVSVWDASGNQIASVLISTSDVALGQTYFQSIAALSLDIGQTYYLGAVRPDNGYWLGDVIVASGELMNGSFSVAPEISYLGYAYGTNSAGAFPLEYSDDPLALFVGPNFLFTVPSESGLERIATVPEPTVFGLLGLGLVLLALRRSDQRSQ